MILWQHLFWQQTSGTWLNVAAITLGASLGTAVGDRLPQRFQQVMTQSLGLLTMILGIQLAGTLFRVKAGMVDGVIVALVAMIFGGIIGEWLNVEKYLDLWGDRLKGWILSVGIAPGMAKFTEGFVTASLLFCIGPMAILGSLENGLRGDLTLLGLKSALDGVAAIAFGSVYGVGVAFSALPVLLYQGSLSLLAGLLATTASDAPSVLLLTGVGGLLLVGLGLNLLGVTQMAIANFLPALLLMPLIYTVVETASALLSA
ncbi:MAG: DUF554 domain-containing protein [Oscillatoriales cyanobacterium SM2_2_1]|nr:DUF554 domain-containing protein [Oscillatoriales cyanobacterium SM2_2_1]